MIHAAIGGLIVGLLGAVFTGSEAILVMEAATPASLRRGLAAAAGVATASAVWAVAFSVLDVFASGLRDDWAGFWKWVTVAAIVLVGAAVLRNQLSRRLIPYGLVPNSDSASRRYVAFLGRAVVDPVTAIFFVSLVVGPDSGHNPVEALAFVVAVFSSSLCWQTGLAVIGARRAGPISPRARRRMLWVDCVLLTIFAAYIALAT